MDVAIYARCHSFKEFFGRKVFVLLQPMVDAVGSAVMHTPFLAEDAHAHVVEVVLLRLLEGGIIALLLKFLGFQVVARVIFVRNRERNDLHVAKALIVISLTS